MEQGVIFGLFHKFKTNVQKCVELQDKRVTIVTIFLDITSIVIQLGLRLLQNRDVGILLYRKKATFPFISYNFL